jgi:hypothetical protein
MVVPTVVLPPVMIIPTFSAPLVTLVMVSVVPEMEPGILTAVAEPGVVDKPAGQ